MSFQTMNTKRRRDDDSDSDDERYMKVRVSLFVGKHQTTNEHPRNLAHGAFSNTVARQCTLRPTFLCESLRRHQRQYLASSS